MLDKGLLVEFNLRGERCLAVIDRPEGKKFWQVTDQWGNSHNLKPSEIEFIVPQTYLNSFRQIEPFVQEVQPFLDESALSLAWEFFLEDNHACSPVELAQLLFSSQTPVTIYASHYLLSNDKIYFKHKGDRYEPRPQSQVSLLLHQLQVTQQKAKEQAEFWQKLREHLAGKPQIWADTDRSRLICLEKYVVEGDNSVSKLSAQEILTYLQRPRTEASALQLLVDLGIWSIHENIALKRSTIPVAFGDDLLAYAQQLIENPIPDQERLDLTHLQVYTIDDSSTTEIDDGLSWDGEKLWIHIADPTRWTAPDDPLDRSARKRGTTVYLPTGSIPMFPPLLAEGVMSLVQGQKSHALSFAVWLDPQGAIEKYSIHVSWVLPTYRITYEDANQLLELAIENDLNKIAELARLRSQWRNQQNAININLPETQIKVKNDQVTLEMQQNTFSRQMVAEMMILTGEVTARYAQSQGIPIPYRSQVTPELPPPEKLEELPPGVVRDFAVCRCMTKGEVKLHPFPHAGLGLEVYTQATSPIRRYTDMLVHWQIKAHLIDRPLPFGVEQLDILIKGLEPAIFEASQVEKLTQRYWTLVYLQEHRQKVWQVTLLDWLRENDKLALVIFDDLGLKLPMRLQRNATVGDILQIRVSEVDARQDVIQFVEVV